MNEEYNPQLTPTYEDNKIATNHEPRFHDGPRIGVRSSDCAKSTINGVRKEFEQCDASIPLLITAGAGGVGLNTTEHGDGGMYSSRHAGGTIAGAPCKFYLQGERLLHRKRSNHGRLTTTVTLPHYQQITITIIRLQHFSATHLYHHHRTGAHKVIIHLLSMLFDPARHLTSCNSSWCFLAHTTSTPL